MRLDRLTKQLRAQQRADQRDGKLGATRIRQQLADVNTRIKAQVHALEEGIEPELVGQRIAELRADREALEAALAEIAPTNDDTDDDILAERIASIPDLTQAFVDAPFEVKRRTLEAFDLKVHYDRAAGKIEISADIAETVANALKNEKALREEGLEVTVTAIAGDRFAVKGDPIVSVEWSVKAAPPAERRRAA